MATPEMIAAVSAAVKGEDPPEPTPAVAEPSTNAPSNEDASSAAAAPAKPEDLIGDPAAVAAAVTPQLDDQGRIRGPDGKFVAATPKPGEPAAPVAATAPAAAAVVPPKVVDPINDPVPPNARPETRERITTLANMVKEEKTAREAAAAEVTAVRADFDAVMAPITEAGASLEQFQESMNLVKLLNSPHQHEQKQALQYLQGAAAALAERLGEVPAGADPLTGFPDLIAQVQANPAVRKLAEDAARGRRAEAASQQHQQSAQRQSEQARVQQQAVQQGQAAVKQVEQTLEVTDPQYKATVALMRADAAFVNELRALPPSQWAPKFAEKYRSVRGVPPASTVVRAGEPAQRPTTPAPLRAKQPAGSAVAPPKTMLDAVRGALRAG